MRMYIRSASSQDNLTIFVHIYMHFELGLRLVSSRVYFIIVFVNLVNFVRSYVYDYREGAFVAVQMCQRKIN